MAKKKKKHPKVPGEKKIEKEKLEKFEDIEKAKDKEFKEEEFWKGVKFPIIEKAKNLFKNKAFKFIFLFSFFIFAFYILFLIISDKISFFRDFVALNVTFLLNIFGVKANVSNSIITMDNFSMEVIFECTPIFTMLIFFSCVLAYPANINSKIKGILFGGILIYFIDILRLLSLAIIGKISPEIFNYIHTYLWQITLIIVVLSIWLFWIDKFTKISINKQ